MNFIEKLFGTHSERELKMIYPIVEKIEALRPKMIEMTDEQLRDNTRIQWGNSGRYSSGGICDCPGGSKKNLEYGALSGTADRWYCTASGPYCRDENW